MGFGIHQITQFWDFGYNVRTSRRGLSELTGRRYKNILRVRRRRGGLPPGWGKHMSGLYR